MIDKKEEKQCAFRKTSRCVFLYFIELVVVISSLTILASLYRTLGSTEFPLVLHEPAVVTIQPVLGSNSAFHEVHISRDVTYINDTPVIIETQLINKSSGASLDLQTTKITPEGLGKHKTNKLYYVGHLTSGTWCIKSIMYWTPFLSLRERTLSSKESCFDVNK